MFQYLKNYRKLTYYQDQDYNPSCDITQQALFLVAFAGKMLKSIVLFIFYNKLNSIFPAVLSFTWIANDEINTNSDANWFSTSNNIYNLFPVQLFMH